MKAIIFLFFMLISGSVWSQKIHVIYTHVRSPIATLKENLYIDGSKAISKQDSLFQVNTMSSGEGNYAMVQKGGGSKQAVYYLSNIGTNQKNRDYFFTSYINPGVDYFFVHDKVPAPVWKIDHQSTKKIAGYVCTKATTLFRGSAVTAYFAKDLPYSAGPFKFFGLPGLILDVRADNKDFDIWKADKVIVNYPEKVNFAPAFKKYTKIEMKDFMEIKEKDFRKRSDENLKKIKSFLPSSVEVHSAPNSRFGIEKIFEWETKAPGT
ncbi:MAG: GLPGLI family protein [Chryseobacterium sp.]|uniref:GLPGLI family protein n=1 Tax=Chryseobacterium sp. TaxID=1871047 RepID=UPI00282924B2|nr:GLPGLI family protein [Chryseobacterium sp.]MDR2235575.1 GLPGLI family protein [Chryseobacterium sp.]